jgi:hypothetical protein
MPLLLLSPAQAVTGGEEEVGPARAHLVMLLSDKGGVCSAVVVAKDRVLTAAHCVDRKAQYAVHYRSAEGKPVLVPVSDIALHPGYVADAARRRKKSVDLARVTLAQPLPKVFRPAVFSQMRPRSGENVELLGWGLSQPGLLSSGGTLRRVTLTVTEPHGPPSLLLWLKGFQKALPAGACQGDSGGAVMQDGRVIGITAFAEGDKTGQCGTLTQAIQVGPYQSWFMDP